MFKKLFAKKPPAYSVCAECGVHFEPVTDNDPGKPWGFLCREHRLPAIEESKRRMAVIKWATDNWERLEEQYKAESDERRKREEELSQKYRAALQQTACAAHAQQCSGFSGSLSGFDIFRRGG